MPDWSRLDSSRYSSSLVNSATAGARMMTESTTQAATRRPITAVGSAAGNPGAYDGSVAGYG